jgi:hypothetical protein
MHRDWKQYAASDLDRPPRYRCAADVMILGEQLSRPIHWQGHQWAVTSAGLECRDGTYTIKKGRLWEEEAGYGWVRHMSEKGWVNLPDFAEALRIARHVHRRACRR